MVENLTQEEKELLLKDLCARLPYGVKVNVIYSNENASSFRQRVCVEGDNELNTDIIGLYQRNEIDIKPYLFPMSYIDDNEKLFAEYITTLTYDSNTHSAVPTIKTFDFYNKYHIDYRGLIEKGLALDATGKNIY